MAASNPYELAGRPRRTGNPDSISATDKSFLCENMSFAATEAYKLLRTNIRFSFSDDKTCHSIGVTSAQPGEGKTLTAINLAWSLAQLEKRVLLVSADMRLPTVEKKLGISRTPGLSNLLAGMNEPEECMRRYSGTDKTLGFDILVAGDMPPNPSELLSSERMKRRMESFATRFDYIIYDLTPIGSVSDAVGLSALTDGIVLVVRENVAEYKAVSECVRQLKFVNCRIIGFVMNGVVEGSAKRYSRGYYKKYGKSYKNYYYGYGNYGRHTGSSSGEKTK